MSDDSSPSTVSDRTLPDGNAASERSNVSDRIEVSLPLRTEYLSTLRTIAASLGADAGFSIDEIDDVRLGLGEVMAAYIDRADTGDRAVATFLVGDGTLTVRVGGAGDEAVEFDELARGILESVLDRFEIAADGVTLVKQATEARLADTGFSSTSHD